MPPGLNSAGQTMSKPVCLQVKKTGPRKVMLGEEAAEPRLGVGGLSPVHPFSWHFRWNSLPGRPPSTPEVLFRERSCYWMTSGCPTQGPAVSPTWLSSTGEAGGWAEMSCGCKVHTDFQGVSRKKRNVKYLINNFKYWVHAETFVLIHKVKKYTTEVISPVSFYNFWY